MGPHDIKKSRLLYDMAYEHKRAWPKMEGFTECERC